MSKPREGVLRPSSWSDAMNFKCVRRSSAATRAMAARSSALSAACRAAVCRRGTVFARAGANETDADAQTKTASTNRASLPCEPVLPREPMMDFMRPSLNLHAAPEGDAVFNLLRRVLRLRVVPRGVFVQLAAHDHVVITRRPLPRADRVRLALAEVFLLNRGGGEVVVTLDHDRLVALRQNRAFPSCFHLRRILRSSLPKIDERRASGQMRESHTPERKIKYEYTNKLTTMSTLMVRRKLNVRCSE